LFGEDYGGQPIEKVFRGRHLNFMSGLYLNVAMSRLPLFASSSHVDASGPADRRTKRLLLPMSDDGEIVSQVICFQVFGRGSRDGEALVIDEADRPAHDTVKLLFED
jgi:hypothetical protein